LLVDGHGGKGPGFQVSRRPRKHPARPRSARMGRAWALTGSVRSGPEPIL
jgi:hypothetical protein